MALHEGHDVLGPLLMRESLDHCVKCTICETFCPVSNVTPLFPGPKYVGPQAERFRVDDEPSPDASLDYCSGCGICTQVCPQGVHIAEINTQARAEMKARRKGVPLRDRILARPTLAGRLGTPVGAARELDAAQPAAAARGRAGDRHPPPRADAEVRRPHVPALGARPHASPPAQRRVAFFHGCGTNYYEPRLGEMTVALLEHNGIAVDVPKQDCCGLPLQSNGLFDDARGYVHRLAERLAPFAREGVDIVGTSTSCTLMLKREALEILGMDDDADLRAVSERVFDICEYLLAMHERGELKTDFQPVPETVVYHAPVPAAGPRHRQAGARPVRAGPRAAVIESDATCCGVAGTYGLKREKYDIAMKVGAGLFAQIAEAAPDRAVCDSETCRWQIEHATGRAHGASGRGAPPRVRPRLSAPVVGLVIVSHSAALADGVVGARARDGRRGGGDRGGGRAWRTARSAPTPSACCRPSSAPARPTACSS